MAYLRIVRQGKRRYYYVVESRREGATVKQKIVEYLGARPGKDKIARACEYWGVKAKGGGR